MSKTVAIIVAAGQGARMGADLPKQYLPLAERSVLATTLDTFITHQKVQHIICVINPEHEQIFLESIGTRKNNVTWTNGGKTRQHSVRRGLEKAQNLNPDHVLIHDAARPFVASETITELLECLNHSPACLPMVPVTDSLKQINNHKLENRERENLFNAQTPQAFSYSEILQAHKKANKEYSRHFTDDIAVAEWAGMTTSHVTGTKKNFKITTTEDYDMARQLATQKSHMRIGHGYDVHAFEEGTHVILCGIEIPFDKKLKGHSDADVGLHALTDAIYGAIGDGDIGHHFPPSEEKWKGAASHIFLEHAVSRVKDKGGVISNLDVTLVCEAPKIGPHRDQMRNAIATITELNLNQISVKATTSEGLGFTGRGEGISAFATACIML